MADKRTDIIFRFGLVYAVFIVLFAAVIAKAVVVMTVERNNWLALHARTSGEKKDVVEPPKRGNIYACDGRLMASSVPTYRVYMDMRVENLKEHPEVFYGQVDSLSLCLARLFKDKPASAYKSALVAAFKRGNRRFSVYPHRIPYYQWKELQSFPLYRLGRYKSGLFGEEYVQRVKPFGSLAARTVGDVYPDLSKGGSSGIEYSYNKVLTGKPGLSTIQKVANRRERIVVQEPEDGMDVVTTIDIDIQDISEHALLDVLERYHAKSGYAVFMEVKTGEVKSIVNMYRSASGRYYEKENGALSDMMEPGSTFKTLVLMALLDEGKVRLTDTVDVGNGRLKYHPRAPEVTDHNARKGGYGRISVANVIHGSSNIGMHKMVYDAYGDDQGALVDKLHSMKVGVPMNLEIQGAAKPMIKHPEKNKDWSTVTSLSALSRGYEIIMPPIYTLAYYNAIANDGKLIRPFFVKSVNKDGMVVKTYKTETINSSICKSSTLKQLRQVLLDVVEGEMGTARPVRSDFMHIAGKTGTARMVDETNGRYMLGHYRISFCGYFPADNPQYTGIVVVNDPNVPSAGMTSCVAFKNIAERIMALKSEITPDELAEDTLQMKNVELAPHSKDGNYKALQTVMRGVHQSISGESDEWVRTGVAEDEVRVSPLELSDELIPDVRGMGVKDAVFLLEKRGLEVHIHGYGKVVSQDVLPGTAVTKGRRINLVLRN